MFDIVYSREWADAQRTQKPLSMVLFDIDYFKQYNDCYGHLRGDDCLKRVAQLLDGTNKRPRDFFARYGGEEFILLLPETDAIAAKQVAERCRLSVLDEKIIHDGATGSAVLTVSLGVGTVSPGSQDEGHAFIHQVDQRLYRAKTQGRNRVVCTG
jgi:diguanylate cyclase (GGDEF)-like protein